MKSKQIFKPCVSAFEIIHSFCLRDIFVLFLPIYSYILLSYIPIFFLPIFFVVSYYMCRQHYRESIITSDNIIALIIRI